MSKPRELAIRFMALFEGLGRVYGRYEVVAGTKPDEKGKLEGPRSTRHGSVTVELWEQHLVGEIGLGVVPITDSSTARFGAIDVDVYPLDLEELNTRVRSLGMPLTLCRTKSGGAHLYLFTTEFVPAELVRSKLMEWAVVLGYPGVEVFPKQTRLASDKDEGNWINCPYQSGRRTTRYALGADNKGLSPEAFLEHAARAAITEEALVAFEPPKDDGFETLWAGAPPCLQTLARKGFGDWQNNGLFNIGVYLRKRHGEGWEHDLGVYNQKYVDPPVGDKDLRSTQRSVNKKDYSYMCRQDPVCGVCNRQVCLTRDFGVAGAKDDAGVVFGDLVVLETDPPTWIWDVDGARLELTTQQLMDQRQFHGLAVERLRKWPVQVKEDSWRKMIREKLEKAEGVRVPEDATKEGQLWVQLARFCTSRVVGRSLDELLLGKPYTDEAERRTYFCSSDFMLYLQQHRVAAISEKDLYRFLRRKGLEHHFKSIKGKGVNYWSVPMFDRQTEEHAVPKKPPPEAM